MPVRVSEAWLLIDLPVICRAAGRPNGRVPLQLPPLASLERLSDPKTKLKDLLIAAAEKSGRQLSRFQNVGELSHRCRHVARLIQDFSPLLLLPASKDFVERTRGAVEKMDSETATPNVPRTNRRRPARGS